MNIKKEYIVLGRKIFTMNIFVCLDENGGMTFNNRRQSSDRVIRKDMLQMVSENTLYITPYSAKQFAEETGNIVTEENCLEQARETEYVFIENLQISDYLSKIQQIIVYRWKRAYPADFFFDMELPSEEWTLSAYEELEGHSHECIGKEIYTKISKE